MSNKQEKKNKEFVKFAEQTAHDAYIFGYPLVLMDVTKCTQIGDGITINTFHNENKFPDASFKNVVSPNVDTLYSDAWLNLSHGPVILSVPQITKCYYVMELLDAWTNVFASIGTRTTGIGAGDFAIIGPNWNGSLNNLPPVVRSPTNMAWIIGRIYSDSYPNPDETVREYQNKFKLTPSNVWGVPSVNESLPPTEYESLSPTGSLSPPDIVAKLKPQDFFNRLNMLMVDNPPAPDDAIAMLRFREISIVAGRLFDLDHFSSEVENAIESGYNNALNEIGTSTLEPTKQSARKTNYWSLPLENVARFGTDYLQRAIVAYLIFGLNLPEDAVYANSQFDSEGNPLSGKNKYTICFRREEMPPVRAFWSLTMYNTKQQFVANSISRYALGSRDIEKLDDKLHFDEDGSLTLYLQNECPGDPIEKSNWLPAPNGENENYGTIIMRLYWPLDEVLFGKWIPPAIKKVQ
ncbi:14562_t:CDS:1 [Cetraspora pellucida]|uniref:14562_t:CDS:1 n=1 Tax=Cetraspora pellucida TaxID=1433469 RepID=A0ACA9NC21_9GLOM|nr:14562_t:CDS:1 [Cetraspora pellucida]